MADFRLYKDFYKINVTSGSAIYTAIDVNSISASVINLSNSSTVENVTIVHSSTGVYYAILNPILYSYSNIYELRWDVVYISGTSSKRLVTRFRIEHSSNITLGNIVSNIGININDSRIIEISMKENDDIKVEVNEIAEYDININQDIEYELLNDSNIEIQINNE